MQYSPLSSSKSYAFAQNKNTQKQFPQSLRELLSKLLGETKEGIMAIRHIESHWRDTARTPRFFMIDARSAFPLLFFLVHIKLWTFVLAVIATLFFALIDRYGFKTIVFLRATRSWLAGKIKYSKPWWRAEKFR